MNENLETRINQLLQQSYNQEELLHHLKQLVQEQEEQSANHQATSLIDLAFEKIQSIQGNNPPQNGIFTGFTELDETYGGFHLGDFVVVGARPSMGKTQWLVNLALNISDNHPVLYFSYDLSLQALTNRFLASLTGIEAQKIQNQQLSLEEKEWIYSTEEEFSKYKLFLSEGFNNSMHQLKALCKQYVEKHGIQVLIIDYLQMMGTTKYRSSRELEMSYISRELKNIAKDLNICVIAASQLSRAVETRSLSRHPMLSDLRESGAIEQNADKVLFLYRPVYYGIDTDDQGNNTEGLVELILAKNRSGGTGTIKLHIDDNFTHFTSSFQAKNNFIFDQTRLDELADKHPIIKDIMEDFDLDEDTPF